MCFRLVEAEKAEHRVSRLCKVLAVTRQGYYAWRRRQPSKRELADRQLSGVISEAFVGSRQTYGAPRVQAELREAHQLRVGRKRVARLMRQAGIAGVSRRSRRRRLQPSSGPAAPPAPDLVGRRFWAEHPDQLWLAARTASTDTGRRPHSPMVNVDHIGAGARATLVYWARADRGCSHRQVANPKLNV
ncbi:MAG: IS3 family transposase [Gaiellaceae bacterium]